jgi:ubiquinone/menaquinone biosynthesis C-methylase UbiE
MMTMHREVSQHYTIADLESRILAALEAAGKDLDALTVDDLAPVDEFHIRGRAATEQLAGWADVRPGQLLLDVGCGLGGTSRYLAATAGCEVVGLDLVESYCRIAERLSARVGVADRTTFRQGSALALPFADGHFDVVWTEHVQMNIADKAGFYRELHRVLKPDGQVAFHDILAGPEEGSLHFPVPWAAEASISHLIAESDLRDLLDQLGLDPVRWVDTTEESAGFFRTLFDRVRNDGWPAVGLHLLMGDDAATKLANVRRNLEEGRLRVIQAIMKRAS